MNSFRICFQKKKNHRDGFIPVTPTWQESTTTRETIIKVRKAASITDLKNKQNHSHCTSCLCDTVTFFRTATPKKKKKSLLLHPPILLVTLSDIPATLLHIFQPNRIWSNPHGHNQQEKTFIIPVMYACTEPINYIQQH